MDPPPSASWTSRGPVRRKGRFPSRPGANLAPPTPPRSRPWASGIGPGRPTQARIGPGEAPPTHVDLRDNGGGSVRHGRRPEAGPGGGAGAGAGLAARVPRAALRAGPRAALRPHPAALRRPDADALRRAPGLPRRLRGVAEREPGGRAEPRAARGAGRGGGRRPRGARRPPQRARPARAPPRHPLLRQAPGAGAAVGGGGGRAARQGPRAGGAGPGAGTSVYPAGWCGRPACLPGEYLYWNCTGAAAGSSPGLGTAEIWLCVEALRSRLSTRGALQGSMGSELKTSVLGRDGGQRECFLCWAWP